MTTFTNQKATLKTRGVAVLTGGVLAATALFHPAPVQADAKKDKTYKAGAAALGVIGAYFILKGKTVPGAIAGAGAYYAYKKSKDAKNDDRYSDNYHNNDGNNTGNDYYANSDTGGDDYYSNNHDTYPDGSWSTPASSNRNRDYNGIASSSNNTGAVILK